MFKISAIIITIAILFIPLTTLAQAGGIPLQKDVFLEYRIDTTEDLPDQVTFNLYNSQTATTPIGTQTFTRGQYTVDFEFSKSDGSTSGTVARINANFTNKLDIDSDPESAAKTKEIWAGIEVGGTEIADRTQVSDETMVQLLLASDASIATYLTLVYEGDDNPITTIYKDLPISSLSSDGSASSLDSYFSAVAAGTPGDTRGASNNWVDSDGNVYITSGNVGIGTTEPVSRLDLGTNYSDPGTYPNKITLWQGGANKYFGFGISVADLDYFSQHNHRFYTGYNGTPGSEKMVISSNGNVGIGTTNSTYKLAVNGTVRAKEIIVDTGWSDFVFEETYKLPPLHEVEQFIQENRHLPGIPTETEVKEKGVSVGNISSKLLQKSKNSLFM